MANSHHTKASASYWFKLRKANSVLNSAGWLIRNSGSTETEISLMYTVCLHTVTTSWRVVRIWSGGGGLYIWRVAVTVLLNMRGAHNSPLKTCLLRNITKGLRVPCDVREFLSGCPTGHCSRRAQLHGVSQTVKHPVGYELHQCVHASYHTKMSAKMNQPFCLYVEAK
jgi:hypothetical protein